MEFVKHLNLLGVEAKEIPCIVGEGNPTITTKGAVGCLYMNSNTGETFKCIQIYSGDYIWVSTENRGIGEISVYEEMDGTGKVKPISQTIHLYAPKLLFATDGEVTATISGLTTPDGTDTAQAVNVAYVNNKIGDVETALDSIIAIQNTLIGVNDV